MSNQGAQSNYNGRDLENLVVDHLETTLGFEVERQVKYVNRKGALGQRDTRFYDGQTSWVVECKYQSVPGSAEEKLYFVALDAYTWPSDRKVLFLGGPGWSNAVVADLRSLAPACGLIIVRSVEELTGAIYA